MFEKLLNTLSKNIGYTIIMIVAVIFFIYFSDGLIEGLIAAVSAMIAYTCGAMLYKEYKATAPAKKTTPTKKTTTKKKR